MKIDRFEISSDLGKYIEYNCELIKCVHVYQNDCRISIVLIIVVPILCNHKCTCNRFWSKLDE